MTGLKQFNDAVTPEPNYWPSVRLADVAEVGHRFRRSGMRFVETDLELLQVRFEDPVIGTQVSLEIEPCFRGDRGWFWYAHINLPNGFSMGPLADGRFVLVNPWPRQVVRSYLRDTWYERHPVRRKKW
jgi:hypothetical protein